jgi:hypothetical protein
MSYNSAHGFCSRFIETYSFYIASICLCISIFLTNTFARNQREIATSGFYSRNAPHIIFPLHFKYLKILSISLLLYMVSSSLKNSIDEEKWLILNSFSGTCIRVSVDSISVLLFHDAMSRRVIVRSIQIGLFSGTVFFITLYYEVGYDLGIIDQYPLFIRLFRYLYITCSIVIDFSLWIAPNSGFMRRRPSVMHFGRFWSTYYLALIAVEVLVLSNRHNLVEAGICLYGFVIFDLMLGCFAIGYTYYVFTIEAKCWHGIEVDSECCQFFLQKVCCAVSSIEIDSSAISTVLRGIELSGPAGLAMSHVREYLDDGSPNSSVKMLDFSSIRINQQKLLGAGSTARVYLGEWNGRKCAVKLLYTVEITAEEVCSK